MNVYLTVDHDLKWFFILYSTTHFNPPKNPILEWQ